MTLRDKPLTLLRRFARNLGWSPLKQYNHLAKDDAIAKKPYLITCYESGQAVGAATDFFLMFREAPTGQAKVYEAAVFAFRYRLCTPWIEFTLRLDKRRQQVQLEQLRPWIDRTNFDSLKSRNHFRKLHPQCTGYTWRKNAELGLPIAHNQ